MCSAYEQLTPFYNSMSLERAEHNYHEMGAIYLTWVVISLIIILSGNRSMFVNKGLQGLALTFWIPTCWYR